MKSEKVTSAPWLKWLLRMQVSLRQIAVSFISSFPIKKNI